MTIMMRNAFKAIGAEARIEVAGHRFEIDVQQHEDREVFQLKYPWIGRLSADALDVQPRLRHLVLGVFSPQFPEGSRYLCGHDERHWFVASLPADERINSVRGAMEALKPAIVLREQKRKGVKHRRHRRKTAAYVRQGEWFFLPRPMMHVGDLAVRGGSLARPGGKPHQVEWIHQPAGRDETFVRGAVSHPDHETIYLQVWHRVVQNAESESAPLSRRFARMTYLD